MRIRPFCSFLFSTSKPEWGVSLIQQIMFLSPYIFPAVVLNEAGVYTSAVGYTQPTASSSLPWCRHLAICSHRTLVVLPWRPLTITFGKVEKMVKKLERTDAKFFSDHQLRSQYKYGNYLEERLPTDSKSLAIWNKIGNFAEVQNGLMLALDGT